LNATVVKIVRPSKHRMFTLYCKVRMIPTFVTYFSNQIIKIHFYRDLLDFSFLFSLSTLI